MNDPHIDIDEIDSTEGLSGAAANPAASPTPAAFEDDAEWMGGTGQGPVGFSMPDMFSTMTQQFRRWQERVTPGFGRSEFELVPPETVRHLRASQREFLMAWRSLIDSSLQRIERQEQRDQLRTETQMSSDGPSRGNHKIIVEEFDD